ncbi:MAG: hypothetical protein M3421_07665 [Bacteroidota bacterium]|nr:hypothetical protein [Bacteroidota bacterium]
MTISLIFYLVFRLVIQLNEVEKPLPQGDGKNNAVIKSIISLPEEIKETSGLAYFNNLLYTHNDKGNSNSLYALNKNNGKIESTYTISDVKNIDWEDLAESEEYIFIGDIGNNDGNRRDLRIFKIKKSKFLNKESTNIKVDEIIEFKFADQDQFKNSKKHNFDSEALIYFKDYLYLFSKNRGGSLCNVYKIPSKSGNYTVKIIDSFNIKGLITGAAIAPSNNRIILTGYDKNANSFIYTLEGFNNDRFFTGKSSRIILGTFEKIGQIEGVVFEDENTIFISSEKTKDQKPKLYKLKL